MNDTNLLLRQLPKVDLILGQLPPSITDNVAPLLVKSAVQKCIGSYREMILSGERNNIPSDMEQWLSVVKCAINKKNSLNYRRVINGTGVVIHTNLGRSLLDSASSESLRIAAANYSNLEFDLTTGKRGSRYSLVEEVICDLTGAEAALVVNNNAAAVLLALNTIAKGHEAIVSRGQLVEIGGSFRIPDVMASSGAQMVEVGATNRTHLYDYENAITPETALLLKVHTSNFRLIGFTSEVSLAELAELGRRKSIPVMEDLGSGSLIDISPWGLPKEPTVQEIVKEGADIVTFSGDKLLGGPQAGIIVGKKKIIDKIKRNPMNRALRIDKFTLSSLETVLHHYYDLDQALTRIPTLAMLTIDPVLLKKRGALILRRLGGIENNRNFIQLCPTTSRVGGGAMPEHGLSSWGLVLQPANGNVSSIEKRLRSLEVPLIGRVENEKMLFDMRTIQEHDISELVEILRSLKKECSV